MRRILTENTPALFGRHVLEMAASVDTKYKTYMCLICGFIYDEAAGIPAEGIAPGTRWEDIPPNWTCPDCGARKEDFEVVQV